MYGIVTRKVDYGPLNLVILVILVVSVCCGTPLSGTNKLRIEELSFARSAKGMPRSGIRLLWSVNRLSERGVYPVLILILLILLIYYSKKVPLWQGVNRVGRLHGA